MWPSLRTSWMVAASLNVLSTSAQEVPGNVAFPGAVEVELVFPRNESYAPTRYFPFVLSISNPEVAKVLKLNVELYIRDAVDYPVMHFASKEFDIPSPNLTSVASKTGPHLAPIFITRSFDIEGSWEIEWTASWRSCTEGQNATTNFSKHSTFFSTKKSTQAVDLVATTKKEATCSATNATIGFNVLTRHTISDSIDMCAEVASPLLTPTPCEVEISSEAASSIAASMTTSLCSSVTPGSPPPREITACPTPESSGAQKALIGGVAWPLALLVYVLQGMW